jgi:epsilon-lactone hydrolase
VSLRLTLLNVFFRAIAKPRLRRTTDPIRARREFDFAAKWFLSQGKGSARVALAGPVPMLRFDPPGGVTRRAVLYFHGGGYIVGSPRTHQALANRLALDTGLSVWLPDYRLAPEHPFPAAWDDADSAWDSLMAAGLAPQDIVLAGESAGGGLAFALLARLCAAGTPPAAVVAFSSWVDLTGGCTSLVTNRQRDPLLPSEAFATLTHHVLGGHRADDPRASPLFADFPGCPPVLLQASEVEIIRDDTLLLAERLRAFGGEVSLQLSRGTPHAWQLMVHRLPEADRAVAEAVAYIRALQPLAPTATR